MPTYIKGKIPWLKIALVVMAIVFIIVIVGFAIPGAGAAMIGGIISGVSAVNDFFFIYPTWVSVVVACAIVGSLIVLVAYRKYFFKQKISNSSAMTAPAPVLQSGLINTQPLTAAPIPQNILANDGKTEVTQA